MVHKIKIAVDEQGEGYVVLDDHDVTDMVTAIGFNTDVGDPDSTEVTLVLRNVCVELETNHTRLTLVQRKS